MSQVARQPQHAGSSEARPGESARAVGDVAPRPSGPAAAVLLAAGIASCALGVMTVLTATSTSVASALTLSDRVGDASGLTTVTAIVFFGAWGALALAWRQADPPLMRCAVASGLLIAVGLVGTFPPVFNAVGG